MILTLVFARAINPSSSEARELITNATKRKKLGIKWEFSKPIVEGRIHWKCNYCHNVKSGGAPCICENILDSSTKSMCTHSVLDQVASCIIEHYEKENCIASVYLNLYQQPNAAPINIHMVSHTTPLTLSTMPSLNCLNKSTDDGIGSLKRMPSSIPL